MPTTYDPTALARDLTTEELEMRSSTAASRIESRIQRARTEDRDLTERETTLTNDDRNFLAALDEARELRRGVDATRETAQAVAEEVYRMTRGVDRRTTARLTVSEPNVKRHAQAIAEGGVFGIEERPEVFERAAVTVATDMGAEEAWATSVIPVRSRSERSPASRTPR